MHIIYTLSIVLIFCACNNPDATSGAASNDTAQSAQTLHPNGMDTVPALSRPLLLNGCYQMMLKRDTVNLQLMVNDTIVTGDLQYDFFEKDRNEGTLKGVLRNDTITGEYTFQSEGTTSVRDVIFKIEDDTLLEGFGDMKEEGGKLVFVDKNDLQFHTDNPFLKVACR